MCKMMKLCLAFWGFLFFSAVLIRGEKESVDISNFEENEKNKDSVLSDVNQSEQMDMLKKYIQENDIEAARKMLASMNMETKGSKKGKEKKKGSKKEKGKKREKKVVEQIEEEKKKEKKKKETEGKKEKKKEEKFEEEEEEEEEKEKEEKKDKKTYEEEEQEEEQEEEKEEEQEEEKEEEQEEEKEEEQEVYSEGDINVDMDSSFGMFPHAFGVTHLDEMIKFYAYIQEILSSQNETSEKKMVRTFLRKSIQRIKKNEEEKQNETIEDIIKNTEGHNLMLEKLAEVMKIDKEKLKDEEIRKNIDKILIGIIKFIDYTNKSNVLENLLNEIEVEEVEGKGEKKKLQVNISNSKTHMEMLQKASDFMGLDITQEKLKELTTKNNWYQNYINQLLNSSGYDDEL